ncbi:MAG TPA: hypothetical protein EYO33_28955 [Phycisphaerales bacterium]|nr:hypothetical protein [Phycisphaerales bacterium]
MSDNAVKQLMEFFSHRWDGLMTGHKKLLSDIEHVIKDIDVIRHENVEFRTKLYSLGERVVALEAREDSIVDKCSSMTRTACTEFLTRNFSDMTSRMSQIEGELKHLPKPKTAKK